MSQPLSIQEKIKLMEIATQIGASTGRLKAESFIEIYKMLVKEIQKQNT